MVDQIRTVETKTESGGISAMAFILGGVVVAVGIIGYFIYGGSVGHVGPGASTSTSVTIEAPAPAAPAPAEAAPAAPAPAPAAPAPAAPAPAAP